MFQRFHAMKERKESGFTLIELLVVILIIAILAAIAIPVFLNQRRKGWISQSQSSLKNAATALETYGTESNGNYTGADGWTETNLASYGFSDTADVGILVDSTATGYCIEATHALLDGADEVWSYASTSGVPSNADCP